MRRLITFATCEYRAKAERLKASAAPFFDEVRIYSPDDLSANFRQRNARLMEYRRGLGYWTWKPEIILRNLAELDPSDELAYADSQVLFESDPSPIFRLVRAHDGIGLCHQKREGHKNSTWTRRDCFRVMGCDEAKYWEGDNLATTFSFWTRTGASIDFATEWQAWCENYAAVSDEPSADNFPGFRDHRHDQSIASILAIKRNRFTLCDPSEWGDGYRCGECHYPRVVKTDRSVVSPWLRRPNMSSIVEVSAISSCALRCLYCPQDKLSVAYHGPDRLTPELFAKCLDNLVPGDAIHFAGYVEPALHPQFVELLEMVLSRGHYCEIYTTGRGLKIEHARRIGVDERIGKVVLHLPDVHGHLSHSTGNVAILDALAAHPRAECMAMDNHPHAAVEHLWNTRPLRLGPMHSRAGNVTLGWVPQYDHRGPIKCGAAPQLDHPVLLPDGRLAMCCMTYDLAEIVGDLSKTSLSEILRGPAIQDILARQRDGRDVVCRKCSCAVPA